MLQELPGSRRVTVGGDKGFVSRIQQAVDQQLQAKGWQLVPSGGSVTVFASDNIHNQKEAQTMYDGFGEATTTTFNQPTGNLVVDLFGGASKHLLWRGLATEDLSSNEDKNAKAVDNDIHSMFKNFLSKSSKS
jgi:Domain of unknown function (DUF4136)